MTGGIRTTRAYSFDPADVAGVQALILLLRDVHGTLDLCDAMPPRTMRRILAGEGASRDVTSYKLRKLLRAVWAASVLVDDRALAESCRRGVRRFARRAPREVACAQFYAMADAMYVWASNRHGDEREALLERWRRMIAGGPR